MGLVDRWPWGTGEWDDEVSLAAPIDCNCTRNGTQLSLLHPNDNSNDIAQCPKLMARGRNKEDCPRLHMKIKVEKNYHGWPVRQPGSPPFGEIKRKKMEGEISSW